LATDERHVVSHDRLGKAFQDKCANLFGYNASPERNIDALTEQNLAVLSLSTQTGSDVAHRAYRRVAGALEEPNLAQRRIALGNTDAKAQIATRSRQSAISVPAASRIATAMPTARAAGSGIGTGSLKNTMMPSPEN
jgi:hypothetical protein